MRGPGGEDHVGILAIMRLAFESDKLAQQFVGSSGSDIQQLCHLHSQLKSIENSRERGSVHGKGVTPKSRRILLGIICHLEIVSNGASGSSAMLTNLFNSAIAATASFASSDPSSLDNDNSIFQICENTFDLAAFSPTLVETIFRYDGDGNATKLDCLRTLTASICRGYQRLSINGDPLPVDMEVGHIILERVMYTFCCFPLVPSFSLLPAASPVESPPSSILYVAESRSFRTNT